MQEDKIDKITEKADEVINAINEQKQETESKLAALTSRIDRLQAEVTELVHKHEFKQAAELNKTVNRLLLETQQAKDEIMSECITLQDVTVLREIEPKRKSVQNMLEAEVAATPKFEKLLNDELGEKSPYEMRKGNNAWLKDETRKAEILHIPKCDIPPKITDIRKKENISKIRRGTFKNADTGMKVIFGRKAIDEIVSNIIKDDKRGRIIDSTLAALFDMSDIIEKSICFDSQISEYDPKTSKNKSPNTLFMHKFYGIMEYEEKPYLACMSIEECFSKSSDKQDIISTSNKLYSFKDIKIAPMKPGLNPRDQMSKDTGSVSISATTISIPQLYNLVKTYDKNFFENPSAVGRAERLEEIKRQTEYKIAVKLINIMDKVERVTNVLDNHRQMREQEQKKSKPDKGWER